MSVQKLIDGKVEEDKVTFNDGTILTTKKRQNLLDLYHNAVYDTLVGDADKSNPLFAFVKKSFTNMSSRLENEKGSKTLEKLKSMVEETQEYLSKGEKADEDFIRWKLTNKLFPWQTEVSKCNSHKITMLCGRRSGKSTLEPYIAVLHCTKAFDEVNGIEKKRSVLMMGLTKERAKDVFWQALLDACELSGMQYKPDNSKLQIDFENGTFIQVVGNNNKLEREKLRGGDWSMIIIDEAQSQAALNYLCVDILGPIAKGRSSVMILSGTGAITNKGYWKDITDGDKSSSWTHFHATMRDNPSIPSDALDTVLADNGWTKDDVTFRREYLAENVIDTTRIVYPVFHTFDELPQNTIINRLAIGIDYGSTDSNAFVALGLTNTGKIYELGCKKFNKADITKIVNELLPFQESLMEKYKVDKRNVCCVADTSDQSISRELWRMKVTIYNAYKVDRIQQIFDMRESLRRGDTLVKSDILTDELQSYVWKYDNETKSVIYETDDDFYHPDALAAMRYAFYYLLHKDKNFRNPAGVGNAQ